MNQSSRMWDFLIKTMVFRPAPALFCGALLVRILLVAVLQPYHDLARFELERTALSLAESGVYGNPYALPTGPSAHVSPGYTLLLAALFRLFGSGVPAEILKDLLACCISAAGCALIPGAALALALPRRTGLAAAWLCALLPIKPLVQIDGDWEAPYASLFLILLATLVVRHWRARDLRMRTACTLGALAGLAILFSSVLLPLFLAAVPAGFYLLRPLPFRRQAVFAATELTVALLFLLPWIVRNQLALGSPIATRSNFGLEMRVSNNDEATPDQRVNYERGVYDHFHPLQNSQQALSVREMGEVAYNRMLLDQTKQWIRTHPTRFAQLCLGRFQAFWFYADPSRAKALFGDVTAILGLFGFCLAFQNSLEAGLFLALTLLLYPAPSYLIQVGARQRYPIDWLLTLLSVYAVSRAWERIKRRPSTPATVAAPA